jgi:hypothetical protein
VGESWELRVMAPRALGKYLAYKGSITINGVSLTVNRIADSDAGTEASINLIPHTVQNTALGSLAAGSRVNLEIDLIARYVERMLSDGAPHPERNPMTAPTPAGISPVEDIVADMRAGRMVILVDEEDRENEGDLVLAADHVTPEAINFMARFGRGLICLTLTRERCERLQPAAHGAQRHQDGHGVHRVDRGRRGRDHRHLGRRPRPHGAGGRGAGRQCRMTWSSPATSSRCRRWMAAC